jgi:ABC-type phosphate/phosphonate transport system substrate-binding protein
MRVSLPPARMRVGLPMYNLPEMRGANTAFWQAMRTELGLRGLDGLPEAPEFDRAPVPGCIEAETLFTQVCGWPLQTIYAGQARLLGMPVYSAPHCVGPAHAGVFVVHRDSSFATLEDLGGCAFAFNSVHSNSGMNLPRRALAGLGARAPFFGSIIETHSQPGNIERVAKGEVDATCVDCVTYAFFCQHRPELAARTRVLAVTPPSPSIPFVTSSTTPDDKVLLLQAALMAVAREPRWAAARAGLLLADIVAPDPAAYQVQLGYTIEAETLGYPLLV